jgi:hypothetical protein
MPARAQSILKAKLAERSLRSLLAAAPDGLELSCGQRFGTEPNVGVTVQFLTS